MALRVSYPLFKAFASDGTFASGYKLYTYAAGTTTPKATYQDKDKTTAHANPVVLNSLGEAEIFLDGEYKFTLTDADDNVQTGWPIDNIEKTEVSAEEVTYTPSGGLSSTNVQDALDEVVEDLSEKADADASGFESVGTVKPWPTETPPTGYLECDGSTISRATYANLFTVIGDLYGVGDGSTTFEIPDYRGEFLRGWNNSSGNDPDAASRTDSGDGSTTGDHVGTKQDSEFEAHDGHVDISTSAGPVAANATGWGSISLGGNESRPRNVAVMWIIKY